jgi:hypothetical protein
MVDGVFFGSGTTDGEGNFGVALKPGALPAGAAQHVDHVMVNDGTGNTAGASFTLTRPAGARIAALRGSGTHLSGRFQVWGFSLGGIARQVYLHYISPSKQVRNSSGLKFVVPSTQRKEVALGNTHGACGFLLTGRRRVFPFSPSPGIWTLQVDTRASYARHPGGPVSRIRVSIR